MRTTRAQDYAHRLLPGAPPEALDALANALTFEHPGVVRTINRHVNREIRRREKHRKRMQSDD